MLLTRLDADSVASLPAVILYARALRTLESKQEGALGDARPHLGGGATAPMPRQSHYTGVVLSAFTAKRSILLQKFFQRISTCVGGERAVKGSLLTR